MTDSTPTTGEVRAMKRIGTVGNYLRVTEGNEHLLRDPKMTEVVLVPGEDGKLVERDGTSMDALASRDLGRIIGEVKTTREKLDSLVTHAARQIGGREALSAVGVEVPEQSIHDTGAGKQRTQRQKRSEKKAADTKQAVTRRTEIREAAKAQEKAKRAGREGMRGPKKPVHVTDATAASVTAGPAPDLVVENEDI